MRINFNTLPRTLEQLTADLRATQDAKRLAAEQEAILADFGDGGRWRFAPKSAAADALRKVEAEQNARTAEAAGRLLSAVEEAEGPLRSAIEDAKHAPTVADALERVTGSRATSRDGILLSAIFETLTEDRLDRELTNAKAEAVLRKYVAASEDESALPNVAYIARVERLFLSGKGGLTAADATEAEAVRYLRRAVEASRDARVPHELRDAQAAVAAAKKHLSRAEALGVRPVAAELADEEN